MGVVGQRHAPAALPPGMPWYPLYRRLGGPQAENLAPPPGFDPRTDQPVASRYTDWAIAAHSQYTIRINFDVKVWQFPALHMVSSDHASTHSYEIWFYHHYTKHEFVITITLNMFVITITLNMHAVEIYSEKAETAIPTERCVPSTTVYCRHSHFLFVTTVDSVL